MFLQLALYKETERMYSNVGANLKSVIHSVHIVRPVHQIMQMPVILGCFLAGSVTLSNPDGGAITLSFNSFETEEGYDFVTVYDSEGTGWPQTSGFDLPGNMTSSTKI